MPAIEIDPAALSPEERKELDLLLASPKILAEASSPVAVVWVLLAVLGAGGLGCLLFVLHFGVVTSRWAPQGWWVAIPYALVTATMVIGVLKAVAAIRMSRLGWQPGRYLLAQGFLDARRRPLRFLPIADFTRVEVDEAESRPTELRLFTMSVHFGDVVEKFHTFGLPQHIPRAALDELSAHRDAALDAQRSVGGYRFSHRASAAAPASPARPRARVSDHPWKVAGVAGVLAIAPIYHAVLPALSLRAAGQRDTVSALRAAERAYPRGWVTARIRPAIHARFEVARAGVMRRVAAERRAPLLRLLAYLEDHDRSVARVRLLAPGADQLAAATGALEAAIEDIPGATAAPVVLGHQVRSLAGGMVGQNELTYSLGSGLAPFIPWDVLELYPLRSDVGDGPVDPQDPVIEIASAIELVSVLQGQGSRRFAALAFEYEAALLLPGEPRALLVPKVRVEPANNLAISRFAVDDGRQRPLGSSGDAMVDRVEDSMVYTKQVTIAAEEGGARLARGLLP